MNSNTEIIIVSVLVSLLVLTLTYLTYLLVVWRRKNNSKRKNEDLAIENGKVEMEINADDPLPSKGKDESNACDSSSHDEKSDEASAKRLDDNKIEVLAKNLEKKQEETQNLSVLTDGSQASTRSQISEVGSKEPSEKGSAKYDTTGQIIDERNNTDLLTIIANGKRLPQCPYKGKLKCSCQQSRRSTDGQRQAHYPTYTSESTKSQAKMVSNNRRSISRLEATVPEDVADIEIWISRTNSKHLHKNGASSKENVGDADEDEDDDTPIMTRMQALGKQVVPPVISSVRHSRTFTEPPDSPHSSFHSRTRPSSPLSLSSSSRPRNRPVSPRSPPVYRIPPGYIYPNGTRNNVYEWQNTPSHHSVLSTSPNSLNLMPNYQMWPQSPPRHQGSSFASPYKSLPMQPIRRSDDYYQQRR
jgi:hypothetical protein